MLDAFVKTVPAGPLPADALRQLLEIGRQAMAPLRTRPSVFAFWSPRFQRIAGWFIETERAQRHTIAQILTEAEGRVEIAAPGGPFALTAIADRIDLRRDGSAAIIDYKTGNVPRDVEIRAGLAPQLPLEAAIMRRGGFDGAAALVTSALAYWRLRGGDPAGELRLLSGDPTDLAEAALQGLESLVAAFDRAETAYECRPRPDLAPRFSDYLHLERVPGWTSMAEDIS